MQLHLCALTPLRLHPFACVLVVNSSVEVQPIHSWPSLKCNIWNQNDIKNSQGWLLHSILSFAFTLPLWSIGQWLSVLWYNVAMCQRFSKVFKTYTTGRWVDLFDECSSLYMLCFLFAMWMQKWISLLRCSSKQDVRTCISRMEGFLSVHQTNTEGLVCDGRSNSIYTLNFYHVPYMCTVYHFWMVEIIRLWSFRGLFLIIIAWEKKHYKLWDG